MLITIIQYLFGIVSKKSSKYIIALIIILGLFYGYHVITNYHYNKGVMEITQKYEKQILDEKRKEEIARIELQGEIDNLRYDLERKQIEYQKAYERGKKDAETKANAIINDIESRNRRLSIEVRDARKSSKTRTTCDSSSTSTGVRRAELSERASRFLITQATLADNKVRELNLCKQTLQEMRKTVDEYNKRLETKKKNKK